MELRTAPQEDDLRGRHAIVLICTMEKCDIRRLLLRSLNGSGQLQGDSSLADGGVLWWLQSRQRGVVVASIWKMFLLC